MAFTMKNRAKKTRGIRSSILLVLAMGLIFHTARGVNRPNWNVVANQYQYSMNVTAVVSANCTELMNDSNILGAFVNGICRGVVKTNTVVGGRNLAYLLVYSNSSNGDTVQFKFYNYAKDSIYTGVGNVIFADNGSYGTNIAPYSIGSNLPPTDIVLSTKVIPESDTVQQRVINISAVDPGTPAYQMFALVAGVGNADNSKFQVVNNALVLDSVLNFYKQDSLHIRLRVTDKGGCYFEEPFVVGVKHTFHPPTNLALTDSILSENHKTPYFVATFITTNYDQNDPYSYQLVAGSGDSDNVHFSISNDSLFAITSFNYELKSAYGVRIQVTDGNGGGTFSKSFVIHIKNDNDPPADVLLTTNKFYELQAVGTPVCILSTKDLDGGINKRKYSYTFYNQGTNDNLSFTLSGDTLKSALVFDYEVKKSYSIYLTTTDTTGASWTGNYTIAILDTLDTPDNLLLSNDSVFQHKKVHSFIGTFSTIDDNGNATHFYSLVSGAGSQDNGSFTVSADSLYSNASFDFETKSNYSIRVRTALVNHRYLDTIFSIHIKETNYEKPIAFGDSASVLENAALGTEVLTLPLPQDSDLTTVFTYRLVTYNVPFVLDPAKGVLTVSGQLNFHQQQSYTLRYVVLNSEPQPLVSDTEKIQITILPVEEATLPVNNYVSPNGDGKNDAFTLISPEVYSDFTLTIYNSSGLVVYSKQGYHNEWDGSGLSAGVYYYTFIGERTYKGNIVLVK